MNLEFRKRIKQLSWSFVSGVVGGVATLVATGTMVRFLGYELFGVISAWIFLQSIIQIFDYGLGSTLNRELTKLDDGIYLKKAGLVFYRINGAAWFFIISAIVLLLNNIANSTQVVLMVLALAIQFQTLYLSAIISAEMRYDDLAKSQIISNIIKYGGSIIIVSLSNNLTYFFIFQVFASVLGLIAFHYYCRIKFSNLPKITFSLGVKIISKLKAHSIAMWVTSAVSIALSSIDRTLIGLLGNTEELGKYTTAITAASMLSLVTLPYYRVYFSEFSSTYFNNPDKMNDLFKSSCRELALLLTSIGIIGFIFAELIFYYWLGSYDEKQIETFKLLLVGMILANLTWLPGALCQAAGKPAIHIFLMIVSIVIGASLSVLSIERWGYSGAVTIWIVHGLIGVLVEPVLINRYVKKINITSWYVYVFTYPLILILISGLCFFASYYE
jgi:O-antigen/teichoic acid export membrane protein